MFLDTLVRLCALIFAFVPEAPILLRNGGFINNCQINTYTALLNFYLLPPEIHEHIKLKFIECMRSDVQKFNYFESRCNNRINVRTCTQLPALESKIAWRKKYENDDIYVLYGGPYGSFSNPHYLLNICRYGMGEIQRLKCYQDASLVTFKDDIIEVYHRKDNEYDVQTWYLDKENQLLLTVQYLSCLQLAILYNCFEYPKKIDPIPLASPFRKMYDEIRENIKNCFFDEKKNI